MRALRLLVLHGPNLDRLGTREPSIYGTATLADVDAAIRKQAESQRIRTIHLQSNDEAALIDAVHAADGAVDGVLFNPGAFTHSSWALRDAVASVRVPVVEVHLSEPRTREAFRQVSVFDGVVADRVAGRGVQGYLDALDLLVARLRAARDSA